MAANIVAPVGVADVGSGRREPGLEGERIPYGDGVSGEADLVAVIAQAAPAVEEQRPLALALLVSEVDIVEPPSGVDSRHPRVRILLPVNPPEVDTLLFERVWRISM